MNVIANLFNNVLFYAQFVVWYVLDKPTVHWKVSRWTYSGARSKAGQVVQFRTGRTYWVDRGGSLRKLGNVR